MQRVLGAGDFQRNTYHNAAVLAYRREKCRCVEASAQGRAAIPPNHGFAVLSTVHLDYILCHSNALGSGNGYCRDRGGDLGSRSARASSCAIRPQRPLSCIIELLTGRASCPGSKHTMPW